MQSRLRLHPHSALNKSRIIGLKGEKVYQTGRIAKEENNEDRGACRRGAHSLGCGGDRRRPPRPKPDRGRERGVSFGRARAEKRLLRGRRDRGLGHDARHLQGRQDGSGGVVHVIIQITHYATVCVQTGGGFVCNVRKVSPEVLETCRHRGFP